MEMDEKHAEDTQQEHRHSKMSLEATLTPSLNSGESIASFSDHDDSNNIRSRPALVSHNSLTSVESTVGGIAPSVLQRIRSHRSGKSITTTVTSTDPNFEVDFEPGDPENPQNWKPLKKWLIIFTMSYGTTIVVLYSTSYTAGIPGMMADWNISELSGALGMTTYMAGVACGSLLLAPLSEMYGRRPVYLVAIALFMIFVIPCALAPNIATMLVMRFLAAFCGSALISNCPGTLSDIVDNEHTALAYSIWSIGPINGPIIGPVIGGFVYEALGWRWTNWVVVITAAASWAAVAMISETYAPALLRKRAKKRRAETDDPRYWSRYDDKTAFTELLKLNLSRPFTMTVREPILIFWDVYVALVYALLYLCFFSYPYVFGGLRGWGPGITGLSFAGIGVGSCITIAAEPLIRRFIASHKPDPETGKPPPEAGVSIVCIAAVLLPIGELWFAWTCTPDVHWIWPILAGIPFGMGNCGVFIYAVNYLVQSYGIYAASALAGNAVLRCAAGATLPLAGTPMYDALGAHWAGTTLGLLEAAFIPIPFIFYRYGQKIRRKSALIRAMEEERRRLESKRAKVGKKIEKLVEGEAMAGAATATAAALDETIDLEKAVGTINEHKTALTNVGIARESSESVERL